MDRPRKTLRTFAHLLCASLLWAALPPGHALADSGDPSARVARLAYLSGNVSIQPAGVDQWSQAEANYSVATGDRVYTDQDGRDELSLGGTSIRMWHGTDLTMTNLNDQLTQVGLAQGTVRVRTYGNLREQVEIDTPNGAVTVMRPGDIRIDTYEDGTQVTVNSGAVQVTGPNLSQDLSAGTSVHLAGTNPIDMEEMETPRLDEFDDWSIQRDRHIQRSRSAEYVSRDTPGYDDLDDYGTWDAQSEYGPIWYPTQVEEGWVPYRTGHWVWAGPYGWTWVESEPWGYAPFHYGRWVNYHSRWGWVPGPVDVRPVWSPALVVFAGGNDFAYGDGLTAWFPLGVGEPYLPWYHCSSDYVRRVNVTNINIVNIHNTTIVNNYNTFVQNTNNYTNVSNARAMNYTYMNRNAGFSAVHARAFATGQPVVRNLAQVTPQQIRTAQVIAHPSIQPTHQSVVTRPVARAVPVPVVRPTLLTQGGRQAQAVPGARPVAVPYRPQAPGNNAAQGARPGMVQQRPEGNGPVATAPVNPGVAAGPARPNGPVATRPYSPGQQQTSSGPAPVGRPPLITRNGPVNQPQQPVQSSPRPGWQQPGAGPRPVPQNQYPGQPVGRPMAPPTQTRPVQPMQAPPQGGYGRPAQQQPRVYNQQPLVIRNEPPAPQPTFRQQQRGMGSDPGRPLEPQQRENLSSGRPAGRPVDQEPFPHQQQLGRPQPAPVPQPAMRAPEPQYRPAPQARPAPEPEYRPAPQARPAPEPQYRPEPQPRPQPQPQPAQRPNNNDNHNHR